MNSEVNESLNDFDDPEPVYEVCDVSQVHRQWTEMREGVNYVAAWRASRRTALRLLAALSRAGMPGGTSFARVRSDGSAVVCVELEQSAAEALAALLHEVACGDLGRCSMDGDVVGTGRDTSQGNHIAAG